METHSNKHFAYATRPQESHIRAHTDTKHAHSFM